MYVLGQMPEPGTADFGLLARYRRDVLNGVIPSTTSFEAYKAGASGTAEPGTPGFGVQARLRRAGIARAPIPETSAPPMMQLPVKYAERVSEATGEVLKETGQAITKGLTFGTALLVVGAAALVGFFLWRRR